MSETKVPCDMCGGRGYFTTSSGYPKGGAKRNSLCPKCDGHGKEQTEMELMKQRGPVGRVNQMLKHGIPHDRRAELREQIAESRWMAGVWFIRLMSHRDGDQGRTNGDLAPLNDAIYEGRTREARRIYDDYRARWMNWTVKDGANIHNPEGLSNMPFERQRAAMKQGAWSSILDVYSVVGLDVFGKDGSGFWHVVDMSMVDYRIKTPRSRATRRWQFAGRDADRVVTCTYCRQAIQKVGVSDRKDWTVQTNSHTLPCGLYFMMNDEKTEPYAGGQ